jgi:hypothetical protein
MVASLSGTVLPFTCAPAEIISNVKNTADISWKGEYLINLWSFLTPDHAEE